MVLLALLLTADDRIERLGKAAERMGGQANLGRALGYRDGAMVGQMLRGERPISEKTLAKLAAHPQIADLFAFTAQPGAGFKTADNADRLDPPRVNQDLPGYDIAPPLRPFRDVPVVGTVQAGKEGYLLELEHAPGHGDGAITYPARDTQSYAVRVRGDSMRPRIKAGEFIVAEPNHECQPGDDVVVVLRDGQRMVKELLYVRDGEATFGSINNGHPNITVPVADIEKMHYVAAIIPRGAFYKP